MEVCTLHEQSNTPGRHNDRIQCMEIWGKYHKPVTEMMRKDKTYNLWPKGVETTPMTPNQGDSCRVTIQSTNWRSDFCLFLKSSAHWRTLQNLKMILHKGKCRNGCKTRLPFKSKLRNPDHWLVAVALEWVWVAFAHLVPAITKNKKHTSVL